ncbi:probable 3-hydroxyisobutyrate dehydrogenase, mitochondrial [Cylas formicarius]|uniref:probable 3-hydroxyisobutyrate dehydrogenase, mitochondrial n=1 Tax=Cylas formicarius TaxID=197179 RepID=UPI00295881D4|nr:probable 3-hydroxyisobutyrate dehydrogenase, mitochondrial [Cylas formicarius]
MRTRVGDMFRNSLKVLVRIDNCIHKRHASSNVAFIGLGQMGARMATNLLKKGQNIKLKVYDVSPAAAGSVKGAIPCQSADEAVDGSDVVITMLPNGGVVKETVLGPQGILKKLSKNAYLLDSSTTGPEVARDLAKAAQDSGVRFLDTPVSGGVVGAADGTLTFMVGGSKTDVDVVEPILLTMGKKVLHCGDYGAGQITKLCNNLILGITMIGTAEALNLGVKLGLDPKLLTSVVNISTGRSWSSDTYNPVPGVLPNVPAGNNYDGGFSVGLIAKDLGLAEVAALGINAPVPLGAMTHQLFRTMINHGLANKDFSVIYKFLSGETK